MWFWPKSKHVKSLERQLEILTRNLAGAKRDVEFYKEECAGLKTRLDRSDETVVQLATAFYRSGQPLYLHGPRDGSEIRVVVIPDEILNRDWGIRINISNRAIIEAQSIEALIDAVVSQIRRAMWARFGK